METKFPTTLEVGATTILESAGRVGGVGESAGMYALETVAGKVAEADVHVLLLGERGVGKRTMARRIHDLSARRDEAFRILPCRALWPEVFETTGPAGLWDRGTVYLDEVNDLNGEAQARLLEVLTAAERNRQQRHVRLICGTARDLEAEVMAGALREDLYYRISGVCLRLPPLRHRREEIPFLMEHLLRKYASDFHLPVPLLSEETRRLFREYSWPGNLRELEDAAKTVVALGDKAAVMGGLGEWLRRQNAQVSLKAASRAASRSAEKELILRALTRTGWNRRRAADELQISYKALLYKLKQIRGSGNGDSKALRIS